MADSLSGGQFGVNGSTTRPRATVELKPRSDGTGTGGALDEMKTPNPAFDGSTPMQVIERGEMDRIWRMLYDVGSGQPG